MLKIVMDILAVVLFITYNQPSYSAAVTFSRMGESSGTHSKCPFHTIEQQRRESAKIRILFIVFDDYVFRWDRALRGSANGREGG